MARQEELMPVPYFHVVFTLPNELDAVALQNQKTIYNILLKASSEIIQELARDKKYLGTEIGLTSILHTWGQTLTLHPHVHMIIPSGGLTLDGKWQSSREKFFISVKVMSRKFRGKFLFYLKQAKLEFRGSQEYLSDAFQFHQLVTSLYQKDWYVYCKSPFKTTNLVIEYLGRYTHRIAISNHRIISSANGSVSFKWRDYNDGCKEIKEKLTTIELIKKLTGKDISVYPVCGYSLSSSRASPQSVTV